MLAEDDQNDRILFELVFRECKIRNPLLAVDDGEGVLEYLKPNGTHKPLPAILFLDWKMRRIGGAEALKHVRANFQHKIPVMVLTGSTDINTIAEAHALGACSFLMKPLEHESLYRLIEGFKEIKTEAAAGPPL